MFDSGFRRVRFLTGFFLRGTHFERPAFLRVRPDPQDVNSHNILVDGAQHDSPELCESASFWLIDFGLAVDSQSWVSETGKWRTGRRAPRRPASHGRLPPVHVSRTRRVVSHLPRVAPHAPCRVAPGVFWET